MQTETVFFEKKGCVMAACFGRGLERFSKNLPYFCGLASSMAASEPHRTMAKSASWSFLATNEPAAQKHGIFSEKRSNGRLPGSEPCDLHADIFFVTLSPWRLCCSLRHGRRGAARPGRRRWSLMMPIRESPWALTDNHLVAALEGVVKEEIVWPTGRNSKRCMSN